MSSARNGLLIAISIACIGCTTGSYNPRYFDQVSIPNFRPAQGRVLIYTTKEDDQYVFSGRPSGFVGSATSTKQPLGEIARQAAVRAFSVEFTDGVSLSNSLDNPAAYRLIVQPHVTKFDYSVSTTFFTYTPKVYVSLLVKVLGQEHQAVWQKAYLSGGVEGPPHSIGHQSEAGENISIAAHKALLQIMIEAVQDIRTEVLKS